MGQYEPNKNEGHTGNDGSSQQSVLGILCGNECGFESVVINDGYRNTDQSLPSGKGNFFFHSYEPSIIDSFETDDADVLLDRLMIELGYTEIIRMYGYTWSVEFDGKQYGEIHTVSGHLDSVKNCGKTVGSNGASTVPPLNTVVNRVCGGCR